MPWEDKNVLQAQKYFRHIFVYFGAKTPTGPGPPHS
jgi:hypothetical protein